MRLLALGSALVLALCTADPAVAQQRPLPSFFYGVTLDDVSKIPQIVASLHAMAKIPIARVVFDEQVPASNYVIPVQQIDTVAYTMGELLDSQYVDTYTPIEYAARTNKYLDALGPTLDLWEVGNEVNGEWLGKTADVVAKIVNAYLQVKARGYKTALTLYYNGPADDGTNSCWADSKHEMFTWAQANIPMEMRQGLDYVLISYYEDDCNGLQPDWPQVFAQLQQMFPYSKIGFGENGTAVRSRKASYIQRYYSMSIPSLPNWIGGHFWWYAAKDFVPSSRPLWTVYNNTVKVN